MACVRALLLLALVGAAAARAAGPDCGGPHCRALALDGDFGSSVSLLQHRGRGAAGTSEEPELAPLDPESQQQRLERAEPLAWIHVPKSGTSFSNFLVRLPGVCPEITDDAAFSVDAYAKLQLALNSIRYGEVQRDGPCHGNIAHWGDHKGAGGHWDVYQSHAVMMLRQPEQRVISGYRMNQHSWPLEEPAATVLEYATKVQGCVVRMLTRGGRTPEETCGGQNGEPIKEEEVELAVKRIRSGFAFVGLQEQWAFSMCLGHRVFGGQCRLSDFVDDQLSPFARDPSEPRPPTQVLPKANLYNVSELMGFADRYDGAVYAAGVEVFNENCKRYNVSYESCQPCFKEAGVEVEM